MKITSVCWTYSVQCAGAPPSHWPMVIKYLKIILKCTINPDDNQPGTFNGLRGHTLKLLHYHNSLESRRSTLSGVLLCGWYGYNEFYLFIEICSPLIPDSHLYQFTDHDLGSYEHNHCFTIFSIFRLSLPNPNNPASLFINTSSFTKHTAEGIQNSDHYF